MESKTSTHLTELQTPYIEGLWPNVTRDEADVLYDFDESEVVIAEREAEQIEQDSVELYTIEFEIPIAGSGSKYGTRGSTGRLHSKFGGEHSGRRINGAKSFRPDSQRSHDSWKSRSRK